MIVEEILKELGNNNFDHPEFILGAPMSKIHLRGEIKTLVGDSDGCYRQLFHKTYDKRCVFALFDDIIVLWMLNHRVVNQIIELNDLDQDISYLVIKYGKVILEDIEL